MREHMNKGNRLLDSLLCSAKDYLVSKNSRSIEVPPFTAVFRGKTAVAPKHGAFETKTGFIKDLSTLTRVQDMSFYEDKNVLIAYGHIQLREFKVKGEAASRYYTT